MEIEEVPDVGRFYRYSRRVSLPLEYEQFINRILSYYIGVSLDNLLYIVYNLPEVREKDIGDVII